MPETKDTKNWVIWVIGNPPDPKVSQKSEQ